MLPAAPTAPPVCTWWPAQAGPAVNGAPDWSRVDGEYPRIPLGVGKGRPRRRHRRSHRGEGLRGRPPFLARYQWAARRHIRGLNVQPIKFKQEILGVLAVFTRIPTPKEGPAWLRIFADEIAGAIVNARAFEEIERLRAHLELENIYLQEEVREARAFGDIIGHTSVDAAPAAPDRDGRADRCLGADPGRIRHGQGAGRPRSPSPEPPQRAPAHPGQLRLRPP